MDLAAFLQIADFDGHMDWDGGWWIVMAIGMLVFWSLVVAGVIWVVRELGSSRRHAGAPDALAVLDRRLAEGAISTDEYRERRAVLAEGSSSNSDAK